MKINPEQYAHLKECTLTAYQKYGIPKTIPEGMTETRYIWDVYHLACKANNFELYGYFGREINDNHIQTAMQKVLAEIRTA